MARTRVGLCLAVLLPFSIARISLAVQPADDSIPIVNWAAPPYWMAPEAAQPEKHALGSKHALVPAAPSNPALAFHAVTPCRIIDTRGNGFTGPYGPPGLTANAPRTFAVTSPGTTCGIPSGAASVSFNFAATTLTANGNLVAYPMGASPPTVSSLNWTPSEVAISNAAVIALASDSMTVLLNGPVGSTADLIVDVNGYYRADPFVTSLNGISGVVSLVPAGGVTITPGAPTITIGTNADSANTANAIVQRDAAGAFAAGTITGTLNGNASGFLGSLSGDVTGSQGSTVVASVGGSDAASVHSGEQIANQSTPSDVALKVIRRDGSGSFAANVVSADGGFHQPGTGGETLRTLRGMIRGSDAHIVTGSGFTVVRNNTGVYVVNFQTWFSDIPAVVVTPVHNAGLFWYVNSLGNNDFVVVFVQPNGTPQDPNYFNFVAAGPP
jgi:hypothetical protein